MGYFYIARSLTKCIIQERHILLDPSWLYTKAELFISLPLTKILYLFLATIKSHVHHSPNKNTRLNYHFQSTTQTHTFLIMSPGYNHGGLESDVDIVQVFVTLIWRCTHIHLLTQNALKSYAGERMVKCTDITCLQPTVIILYKIGALLHDLGIWNWHASLLH